MVNPADTRLHSKSSTEHTFMIGELRTGPDEIVQEEKRILGSEIKDLGPGRSSRSGEWWVQVSKIPSMRLVRRF